MLKEKVCVTGASGYIASHTVQQLLEKGYQVVGTVRDASNEEKTKHLLQIQKETQGDLRLVSANLTDEGAFDEAIQGCDYVLHMASAVLLTAKDPQKEIIDVAVNGTMNVLRSIEKAGCVKKLVLTSSIAAVVEDTRDDDYIFTEEDWNETSHALHNPYAASKRLAEKAAWDFQKQMPEAKRFAMATIQPSFCLGPSFIRSHLRSSPNIVYRLMARKLPKCPNFFFNLVDVRDVAKAHIVAMEEMSREGRYICTNDSRKLIEIAAVLKKHYPERPIPTGGIPNWLMYVVACFDKTLSFSFLKRNLGVLRKFSNKKIQEDLGIEFRSVEESILDTAQSMIDHQLLDKNYDTPV